MMAELNHISKRYDNKWGLKDVSLTIPSGQIIGLLGVNGSGKTTLLKILAGLVLPSKGTALIKQADPRRHRRYVSHMGDWAEYPLWMKPEDVGKFMQTFHDDFNSDKFRHMCQELAIPQQSLGKMSKGQSQKLRLTAAMSRQTDLYLLDEPFSAIDIIARADILKSMMKNWNEQSSIMLATHQISEIEPYLDRVIFMSEGTLKADQSIEAIHSEQQSVAQKFNDLLRTEV